MPTTYLVIRFDQGERYWEERGQHASHLTIRTVLHSTSSYEEAERLMDEEQAKTDRPVNVLIAA